MIGVGVIKMVMLFSILKFSLNIKFSFRLLILTGIKYIGSEESEPNLKKELLSENHAQVVVLKVFVSELN